MDDEIQFGDFQHAEPDQGIAPDRDPHFAVAWVGQPDDGMPIYIDVDVMRELESHALENVDVELGGVLLGVQQTDSEGKPFVVVRDSLRAEHYQATRGSFKFTHETWEAITRKREQFPNPLDMVGWYHTHPGWGVFLSDMDMFICRNFFNHELDVALVIDPLRDDRGWFYWPNGQRQVKRQLARFCLFAHRHRSDELQAIADCYNHGELMPNDPRTRYAPATTHAPASVTVVERTIGPTAAVAVAALVLGQVLLSTALIFRTAAPATSEASANSANVEMLVRERQAQARAESYRAMLVDVVEKSPEQAGVVDRVTNLNDQNAKLQLNLDGQAALVREVNAKLGIAQKQIDKLSKDQNTLTNSLAQKESLIQVLQQRIDVLRKSGASTSLSWVWVFFIGIVAAIVGAGLALGGLYLIRLRDEPPEDDFYDQDDRGGRSSEGSHVKLA